MNPDQVDVETLGHDLAIDAARLAQIAARVQADNRRLRAALTDVVTALDAHTQNRTDRAAQLLDEIASNAYRALLHRED